jgi:fumarylacetoacetase
MQLDDTHDPALASWIASANSADTDFPIQNLPFGRVRHGADDWRLGVAIGDQVLDLRAAVANGLGLAEELMDDQLNAFIALGAPARRETRGVLSRALRAGSADAERLAGCLIAQNAVEMSVPCRIGDYTDFYTGIHHATAVGKLFRPDNPLLPNYKWVPIGYHGRSSSIGASGQQFYRPYGQIKGDDEAPRFAPSERLDYELELGVFVGAGNAPGEPLTMAEAEADWFGMVLLNDWSARDLQAWEYQPLGPFLAKNFASTVSPWVVTQEALAPFRTMPQRPAGDPEPLPHLDSAWNRERGALAVELEVSIQTAAMRAQSLPAQPISRSNFRDAYWTIAQMVTHHASNGCNLQPGDLLGTGTQSGPAPGQGGSLLELSMGGKQPVTLANGETRRFLQDGDTVVLRGWCERVGARRIGLGTCTGTVLPARSR